MRLTPMLFAFLICQSAFAQNPAEQKKPLFSVPGDVGNEAPAWFEFAFGPSEYDKGNKVDEVAVKSGKFHFGFGGEPFDWAIGESDPFALRLLKSLGFAFDFAGTEFPPDGSGKYPDRIYDYQYDIQKRYAWEGGIQACQNAGSRDCRSCQWEESRTSSKLVGCGDIEDHPSGTCQNPIYDTTSYSVPMFGFCGDQTLTKSVYGRNTYFKYSGKNVGIGFYAPIMIADRLLVQPGLNWRFHHVNVESSAETAEDRKHRPEELKDRNDGGFKPNEDFWQTTMNATLKVSYRVKPHVYLGGAVERSLMDGKLSSDGIARKPFFTATGNVTIRFRRVNDGGRQ
ncbi:MAG TPA: hypothetical protein VM598_10155 [Bdellovibrionota bacterium]|nr:hypothetical protein [Bdellovibrionota bacterium]